jgi:IclR family mhp operon transcriptional activator
MPRTDRATTPPSATQYKDVRSLARGLDLLVALNQSPGGLNTTSELARRCGLDRTTTKRLLETLRAQGFVRPGERDGHYCLTFVVRRLSEGYEDETWVTQVAAPRMQAAVRELVWPCDLATVDAGFMVVRESTHRWSALSQHRAMIGQRMPLPVTALGRAYLAACPAAERDALLDLLGQRSDWIGAAARDRPAIDRVLDATLQQGYAVNEGEWMREADFGAVAVPLYSGSRLLGAMNMVFPKAAVPREDLERRWVPALKRLASGIGKASQALTER